MQLPLIHRAPTVPKRVVLFGLMMGLSLAILGLVGSSLVTSLNSAYTEIVEKQLPSMNLIRSINQGQSQNRRLIDSIPLNLTKSDIVSVRQSVLLMREQNSSRLDRLEGILASKEASRLIAELRHVRSEYNRESDKFMDLLQTAPDKTTWEAQRALMIDADTRYVDAQDRLAGYCEQSATARGDDLVNRSKGLTRFFFVVAAWPLILAVGFFTYGLISTLALFYRSRMGG